MPIVEFAKYYCTRDASSSFMREKLALENVFSLQSNPITFLPSLAKTEGNLSSENKQPQTNLSI